MSDLAVLAWVLLGYQLFAFISASFVNGFNMKKIRANQANVVNVALWPILLSLLIFLSMWIS